MTPDHPAAGLDCRARAHSFSAMLPTVDQTTQHVRQACVGDLASVNWLVRRFTPPLLAQARYYLRGPLDQVVEPDDLVQEVWAVAYLSLPDLQPNQGRMTPVLCRYLASTMRNKVLNLLRRQAGRPVAHSMDTTPTAHWAAVTAGVLDEVARAEHGDLLAEQLASLEDRDREVLVLHGLEGHSFEDLAAVLGAEPGALRMRYLRARQRLRDRLPESLWEELE